MKLTINKNLLAHYAKGTLSLLKSSNRLYAVNFRFSSSYKSTLSPFPYGTCLLSIIKSLIELRVNPQ